MPDNDAMLGLQTALATPDRQIRRQHHNVTFALLAIAACAIAIALGAVVGLAIPQRHPEDAFAPGELELVTD